MRKFINEKNYKYAVFTILILLLTATLGTIIILYGFFETAYEEKNNEQTKSKTDLAAEFVSQMNKTAKNALITVENFQETQDILTYGKDAETKQKLINISNLYILCGDNTPEAKFFLVDYANDALYSMNSLCNFYTVSEFSDNVIIKALNAATPSDKFSMKYFGSTLIDDYNVNNYVTYFYFEGGSVNYSKHAIIVSFNIKWIEDKLRSVIEPCDEFILYDENHNLVTKTGNVIFAQNDFKNFPEVDNANTVKINDEKYMISKRDTQGLQIVLLSSCSNMNRPLVKMRIIIILSVVLFVVTLVFSISISSQSLKIFKKKSQEATNKSPSFYSLFDKINNSVLDDMFDEDISAIAGINNISPSMKSCVIFITIDERKKFFSLYSKQDDLYIKNKICETIDGFFNMKVFKKTTSVSRNGFACVIANIEDMELTEIQNVIIDAQKYIDENFGFTVSAAITPISEFFNLQDSYLLAKTISEYNFATPNSSVIFSSFGDNAPPLTLTQNDYNNCTMFLTARKFDEFKDYINKIFFDKITNNSPVEIINNLYSVISICKNALSELSKQYETQITKQINTLHILIKTSWKISEFKERLFQTLDEYKEVINTSYENSNLAKNEEIANTTCRIVEENYTDYNLSVTYIAEKQQLSTVYLCKIFKNVKKCQLNNYINEFRIEKATELIETTSLSIKEISSKCGFSNTNYFYTLFKKFKKITAMEYKSRFEKK